LPRGTAHAPAETRRAEILDAAQCCFGEHGLHGTTVDDIAERAGLSKGALYWHFQGKREIFLALFDRYIQGIASHQSAVADAGSPAEAIRLLGGAVLESEEVLTLAEAALEFMSHASHDEELRDRMRTLYLGFHRLVADEIRRGIEQGSFRPVDVDALARTLVAALDGLLMQHVLLRDFDPARVWAGAIDAMLGGLEP
jgi:AcrR family transcriptional regulator